MPQILLKNAIVKRLGELGYKRPSHIKNPNGAWTIKFHGQKIWKNTGKKLIVNLKFEI